MCLQLLENSVLAPSSLKSMKNFSFSQSWHWLVDGLKILHLTIIICLTNAFNFQLPSVCTKLGSF